MQKLLFVPVAAFLMLSCNNADKKTTDTPPAQNQVTNTPSTDTATFTTIEWLDNPVKNLGNLKKDQEIEISFRFRNTGNHMLIIENVIPACGCTIPEKPEKPFAPGEEGLIKAKFNGSGSGHISKNLTVKANTTPTKDHTLTFTGDIKE